jgi:16S rRNA (adenine1518-N6/adenine1519-N6)-dimethyltransferase
MERHRLSPSRALGQNFVVDPNTVRKIAHLADIGEGDRVVEVGAGLGSLTLALAETGAEVTAVELDRYLLPALREVTEPAGVRVVEGDALTLDWDATLGRPDGWVMVGNLPYNVATTLVLHLLEHVPQIRRMLVMVQREVGERLAADVGHDAYGIPSVKAAYWAAVHVVGRVPPTVFIPQPRVESALVDLRRHETTPDVDYRQLCTLVDAGFGQRRKMLRRSLAGLVEPEGLVKAGISPQARAEELALHDWARLVDVEE